MTLFFSAEGGPIWIKICRLVQNDMSTVAIWPKLKPEVEFQYAGCLGEFNGMSHCRVLPPGEFNVMIPELRVTLQDATTGRIHCHDSRATIKHCHNRGPLVARPVNDRANFLSRHSELVLTKLRL